MDPDHGDNSDDDLIANLFAAVRHALGKESVQQCSSSAAGTAVTTRPYLHQALSSTISKHTERAPLATSAPDDGEAAMPVSAGEGKAVPEVGRSSALDLGLCEADQALLRAVLARGAATTGEGGGGGGGEVNGQLEDRHERALQRVIEENANAALRNLRERRRRAALARQTALARTASRSAAFAHSAKCRLAQARAQGLVKSRRLLLQGADATRRLQELFHECIGEYEKARLRGARSRRLSSEACEAVIRGKILDLRWSRFCSRLEDDALGLVKAYDMGNPAGPDQHPGSHVRRAGVSSAIATDAAGARPVASLLDPLLASCGLSDSRILRVVALCPCSGSVNESGDATSKGGDGGSDLRLRDVEQCTNLAKGLFGCGRGSRRKQAGAGGVEAALIGNGGASSAVSVVAENSRLGVADAFRQAVLCGNPSLVAALSRGDDATSTHQRRGSGGSASTGNLVRPRAATGSRRSSMLGIGHNGAAKGVVGGRKGDRRGGSGSLSEGEGGEPLQKLLSEGNDYSDDDDGSSKHCTVVGSAPGLLLSSSHLRWTLQPPFGSTDDARLLMAGSGEMDGGNSGGDGGGVIDWGNRGDIDHANSSAPRRGSDIEAGPAAGGMHAWDGAGGLAGVESAATRSGSRWQRLALDLAWLGAAPVGSRVYYCLEEAEWEASRRKNSVRRGTSGCRARRLKSRRHPMGSDPPGDTGGDEQRERSRGEISPLVGPDNAKSGFGHNHAEAGDKAGGIPRGKWRQQNATDADATQEAAAMVFARSVSGMLAEAYLDGAKPRRDEDKMGLFEERAGKGPRKGMAAGSGNDTRKGRSWGYLADTPPAIDQVAASLVVSGITDAHRNNNCLDANDDDAVEEGRLLEALDAIPDVLIAEVGAPEPKLVGKWRRTTESPSESLDSAAASDARESHGRRRPPSESGDWRGDAQTPSSPVNASLHFAPAGVLQLLGTAHCREFVEALPPAARARVLALYQGFPDETPQVGHLYVPLASRGSRASLSSIGVGASSRARCPAYGLRVPADRSRPEREKVLIQQDDGGGTGPDSAAVEVGANVAVNDLPPPTSGTAPALLGALVHALPAQAVRELLQVYLATTRAIGAVSAGGIAAGEGVEVRRRTSGLLVLPPPLPSLPLPPFLARGDAAVAAQTAGVDDKEDDNVKGGRRSKSGQGGWRTVPDGGASAKRRPEGLPEKRGDDGMKGKRGWLCLATTPPSAVDVLPDAPSPEDRATDSPSLSRIRNTEGSAFGPRGRWTERQAPFRNDSPDNFIDGAFTGDDLKGEASVGRRQPQTSAMIGAGHGVSSRAVVALPGTAEDAAISSSLQAPYHHAYVAVLAQPPPSAAVNVTGDGNLTGTGNGNMISSGNSNGSVGSNANSFGIAAKVAAAGVRLDPFSSASALILQVERSMREPPLCDALKSGGYGRTGAPATTSGSGNGSERCDEVVVMGSTRRQQGAREMPPRVCGWRACLADAAAGSLCSAHEQVRDFLDGKAAKAGCVSDSFRFLPPGSGPKRRLSVRKRRAAAATPSWPSTSAATAYAGESGGGSEGELIALRSMSPLLSELLNGKLGTTIAMFCQRAAAEAKSRRMGGRRANGKAEAELDDGGKTRRAMERRASGRVPVKTPEWARWADPEKMEVADRKVAADMRWAEQVLRAEKEVTLELRRLSNLGVYPEAELAHIRREHAALATEWRRAIDDRANAPGKGEEDEEDGGGMVAGSSGNNRNNNSNRSSNSGSTGGETPSPNSSCLPLPQLPSGNQRTRGEAISLARGAAAPAPAPPLGSQPSDAVVRLSSETTSESGSGTETYSGGLRRRRKGSSSPVAVSREGRSDTGVRGRLDACGEGGRRERRERAQARGEEEMELDFSRLKWALLRRRREEAERSNVAVTGSTPGRIPTIVQPRGASTMHAAEAPSASDGTASVIPSTLERMSLDTSDIGGGGDGGGSDGGGGGGGGSEGGGGGDLNDIAHVAGASMTPSSAFLAPPAEQLCCQPSPTSTLPVARADKHSEAELLQQRRQHLLLRAPAFSSSSSSSCPPSSRRYRRLAALSTSAGEEDYRASQHQPVGLPRTAATTAAASVGAARQRRRRHSPPIRATRGVAAGSASATSAPMPTARTARAAAAGSHAPARDGSKGERRKSAVGRSGGRAVLRRRASTGAGEGTGGSGAFQVDPFASRGGRRQGFDAAPYQTTVLFRDR